MIHIINYLHAMHTIYADTVYADTVYADTKYYKNIFHSI
mgnify:FL=1